jgi:hypothetical protein
LCDLGAYVAVDNGVFRVARMSLRRVDGVATRLVVVVVAAPMFDCQGPAGHPQWFETRYRRLWKNHPFQLMDPCLQQD